MIKELIKKIEYHNKCYYIDNNPQREYDQLPAKNVRRKPY